MKHKSQFLNIVQAAEYAGVSRPTLYTMIADGLKSARIGSRQKIKTDWVDEYFESKANVDGSNKAVASNILEGMR